MIQGKENNFNNEGLLFDQLKQMPPLLSENEVLHFLGNSYSNPPNQGITNNILRYFKVRANIFYFSALVGVVSVVLLIAFFTSAPADNVPGSVKKSMGSVLTSPVEKRDSFSTEPLGQVVTDREKADNRKGVQKIIDKRLNLESFFVDLTHEELKGLGLTFDGKRIVYLNIAPNGMVSEYDPPFENQRDTKTGVVVEKNGNPEYQISVLPFYAYASTGEQVVLTENKVCNSLYPQLKTSLPLSPQSVFYFRNNKAPEVQKLFTDFDEATKDIVNKPLPLDEKVFRSVDDTLVPVRFNWEGKQKVFWFTTGAEFYNALPKRYQDSVRNFYESVKLRKKKNIASGDLVHYPQLYKTLDYMRKVQYVFLSEEYLSKIWIVMNKKRAGELFFGYDDGNMNLGWMRNFTIAIMRRNYNFVEQEFCAIFYSNPESGELTTIQSRNGKDKYLLNDLVPICIRKEDFPQLGLPHDFVFWYTPTEAFFNVLPSEIGRKLRAQYKPVK